MDLVSKIMEVDLSVPRNLNLRPVADGEQIIGTLPENLQRLYCLRHDVFETIRKEKAKVQEFIRENTLLYFAGKIKREEICNGVEEECRKVESALESGQLINEIFWDMVRLAYPPDMSHKDIGIRDSWNVVVFTQTDDKLMKAVNELTETLERILSGNAS
jgi:hypothetical protein